MATSALVNSAIEFCVESEAIVESLDNLTTVAGQGSYELDSPQDDQRVELVLTVKVAGKNINPYNGELPPGNGRPVAYQVRIVDEVASLTLIPTPDAVYSVAVEAALAPKRDATTFHEQLYERWLEPVCAGAVSRLKALSNQPFSNPVEAAVDRTRALSDAKKARSATSMLRVQRVQPRPFA